MILFVVNLLQSQSVFKCQLLTTELINHKLTKHIILTVILLICQQPCHKPCNEQIEAQSQKNGSDEL